MICKRLFIIATLLLLPAAMHSTGASQTQPGAPARKATFSTPEQMEEDIKAVPCRSNAERLAGVKALFTKMGAPASDISVEKMNNVENIVVRKQGSTNEIVVIGAHYDKVSHGCGAVDNWTGIVAIAHIYRTIKDVPLKKTVLFVGFGREEEGLIGSREMVRAINKELLPQYCAMINIDSLGLGIPQAETGISSKKLVTRAAELAKRMQMPFQQGTIREGDTDSSSFLARKIPAIALHALSNEWQKVLHTHDDKVSKVNPASVFMGYRLALGLFGEVENASCDAFR
ncbi:MAG TPA: M20/M25/M40 family metallo-hydrolase [Pyrinomonadaceae bacterium]|nr:M20/M25/M40 family metallo-hydrolase [Pyrinomonadaceae bacterium]